MIYECSLLASLVVVSAGIRVGPVYSVFGLMFRNRLGTGRFPDRFGSVNIVFRSGFYFLIKPKVEPNYKYNSGLIKFQKTKKIPKTYTRKKPKKYSGNSSFLDIFYL